MINTDILALLAAIPLAAAGGDAFLKGVLGISVWLRLPNMLVATTLAAFATSSPELTVSSLAAWAGKPEIGLGDALGSNVVNIGLVLGLALLFGSLSARFGEIKGNFLLALAVPVLTLFLARDGTLSRGEGGLLLTLFTVWIFMQARQALAHRRATADQAITGSPLRAWMYAAVGLVCLILAGKLFVTGASGIALALGVHAYVIGATVVAIGTSLPELVTTLLARWRGHDDVGLGTLLGSNLFNGLAIVGVAAAIHPIQAPVGEISAALGFGALTVLLILPRASVIQRWRGGVLLLAYAAFVTATLTV
jgi:cation:H+ antiporter